LSYIYHETLRNKPTTYKISQYPSVFYILSNLTQLASRNESARLGSARYGNEPKRQAREPLRARAGSRASSLFSSPTNGHLDLDTGGKSIVKILYRSMIGSLLYLCASRLDIMLSVCMCARFQANPKEVHLRVVKRIMRYLVYTPKFGIWYPKGSTFDLIGYFDVDYAGCKIDRKSTSGTCQFLGRSLVSWASKK
jgi:hypothetical protein